MIGDLLAKARIEKGITKSELSEETRDKYSDI